MNDNELSLAFQEFVIAKFISLKFGADVIEVADCQRCMLLTGLIALAVSVAFDVL